MRSFPRRLAPLAATLALLAAVLTTTAAAAPGRQEATRTDALPTEAVEALQDASAEQEGGFSATVDAAAGWVNGKIAYVFFYDVLGKGTDAPAAGVASDPAALPAAIDALRAACEEDGVRFEYSDVTLTLPKGTSEARKEELEAALKTGLKGKVKSTAVAVGAGEDPATLAAYKSGIPLAVLWLVLGAIFFTLRMGFINLRGFKHAIEVTRGRFDDPEDEGEVSHFQALASALSATVGLGNIAGVAIAISVGGPGATFWMILAGFLGMSSKFTECTLGQKYREVRSDGRVMGGAMFYLSKGLAEMRLAWLGKFLAVAFAVLCIGGSFGGGNTFQVNQSLNALQRTVPFFLEHRWVYGLIMTVMVGIVILGGIRRIAATAEKIVPVMCGIYVLGCLIVIIGDAHLIPFAFGEIVGGAFGAKAMYGGLLGVLVQGFKRAAFSNEAGVGSAAIAHSAAKTEYPVREGIVALLEPFIDTIVVCTMTALVIVITGAYDGEANPEYMPFLSEANGAGLTSAAFESVITWFPHVLSVAVVLFAYSTMISWSYYGERCWAYLFGDGSSLVYRVLFLVFVFLGSLITAQNVLDFGDLMILGMAFPNVLGVVLLSGKVRRDLDVYWGKLRAGELQAYK